MKYTRCLFSSTREFTIAPC